MLDSYEEVMEEAVDIKRVEIHKSGYLKGYANFYIDVNGYEYQGLFRILDRENGKDLNIVSIDNSSE